MLATLVLILCHFLAQICIPTLPTYFTSLLSPGQLFYWPGFLLSLIFQTYVVTILHGTIYHAYVYIVLPYMVYIVPFFVKEFPLGRKCYKSTDSLRLASILPIEYRAAQVLQNIFNLAIGYFLFPLQILCAITFVFSAFMIIRYSEKLETVINCLLVVWCLITSLAWSLVLLVFGYLHYKGALILKSWKQYGSASRVTTGKRKRKEVKMFVLSCQQLKVGCANFFVINRISVLKYAKLLTIGLAKALLLLKFD